MLRKRVNQKAQRRDKSVPRGDLDSGQHPFCIFVTTSLKMAEIRLLSLIAGNCYVFESLKAIGIGRESTLESRDSPWKYDS
jgi:hypothetical protein